MYLLGLGAAPFFDPSEGFHAAIAETLRRSGDWITLRVDGVRYFDKPPLMYWLMSLSFAVAGPTEAAARMWPALAAIGVAAVTGRIGVVLGGPRVGLLSGLFVAANLGIFVFARHVKPDLVFILFIVLAYAGFIVAFRGGGRWGLALFYASLGLAALAKDVLGAIGPLAVVALFVWLTRERPYGAWAPWWGIAILLVIAVPWYLAVELRNPGFIWYTVVDNHLLKFTRQRNFPDEDVPLGALQFLGVTVLAFMPWILAAPWALVRSLRRPWPDAAARLWALLALWTIAVIGFLALFGILTVAFGLAAVDRLPIPPAALENVDVGVRNLAARGQKVAGSPLAAYVPVLMKCTIIFGVATLAMALAVQRRWPAAGLGVALAGMIAFLPTAGEGMAQYMRRRSARPVVEALTRRLSPPDRVVHEGPLENTGSLVLMVGRPVHVVHGLQSNLAFGATFPEARDVFWSPSRLQHAWAEPRRCFLVSTMDPASSVVRTLEPVHLLAQAGGRWLYSNVAD